MGDPMTIPDHELSEAPTNDSRIHFPALKWATAFVLTLVLALAALSWLAWANLREWEWSRTNQQAVSVRVAEDRVKINLHQSRLLNELRLQTFNQMLPPADQQLLLPALLARPHHPEDRDGGLDGLGHPAIFPGKDMNR